MDIYLHTSPKKRMLLSALKIKKSSTVKPEQTNSHEQKKLTTVISTKSTAVTGYLQKKVSTIHAKKMWNQIVSSKASSTKSRSTILFDSNDHLETVSCPPTPPPKKSQTLPNLTIITERDPLIHRALPSLPSLASSISLKEERKGGLTRAKTWVGTSIQKWLSSPESDEKRKMEILMDHSELNDNEEQSIMYSSSLLQERSSFLQKRVLQCRILQVTNLASSKNYQYTMNMRVTNNSTQTHAGVIKRVAKGISAAHPRAALSFDVQGRFQLQCDINIKPCSSINLVDRIKSFTSKNNLSSISEDSSQSEEEEDDASIKGQLILDSGDDPLSSFANKGISRYSIQTSTELALELTVAFWLEENNSEESSSIEIEEEEELSTPIDQDILRYCEAGDYLTFYVRGESYPMWTRYWVSYKNGQLILRLNERGGEPVDKLSLKHLTHIDVNPSDDIQEEVYLGKKHGMILTFGKFSMYLFGDNFKSVRFWKCLLEQQRNTSIKPTENKINKKYLWPVAQ